MPLVTPTGTGCAPAATSALSSGDMSSESGPANGSQPGNGTPSPSGSKKSAYAVPPVVGNPPISTTPVTPSGRRSAPTHASVLAAEWPTTSGAPSAASMAASTAPAWSSYDAVAGAVTLPGQRHRDPAVAELLQRREHVVPGGAVEPEAGE